MASNISSIFAASPSEALKGKLVIDPIVNGFIDPLGRNTEATLQDMDKVGLRKVGETTNTWGPIIAATFASAGTATPYLSAGISAGNAVLPQQGKKKGDLERG